MGWNCVLTGSRQATQEPQQEVPRYRQDQGSQEGQELRYSLVRGMDGLRWLVLPGCLLDGAVSIGYTYTYQMWSCVCWDAWMVFVFLSMILLPSVLPLRSSSRVGWR